ncbi:putative glycosyltransferase EpsJ [Clostridium pasteurianum DSM 525 = ATCC 6013]|uniref:Glycosyl transferase family 2 n=1 Tax=Clostridium pasteurianum DSM 525 = ATCC 6013 TaxID=1262449 RepID=A0A0H3J0A8_CLOPA|nr:glycosyltransferase [Clostridium pasteurianum]AJA46769.1 putative glycosyltransferase EpsJ [Clostridium pasteurianum DSM 525 = ATCC 6013]AJA50757.1 putative glycosyltransferase EpsJ [Clostridium pasteurianum DSM 525 = ATCC 6013]AOZ74162.1 hypothetical protein AQ983_03210 [Clostridium pasteurianum DSM 525 = ATCC 6013]AOZ77960.1 hypothetical protein AQ984_03210 [Clostridium pasteurianum]ELP58621.1 Glycosyltransferases involved in cell wall biogenesis [Clostridium pasteurianum DSM 525 = ATCC 6
MVKISVIVPVYNVEQYLEQCLTSIVNQTMKDIEIIAVNDGSTDNSLNIIKEFAGKYSNLVLLDKENGGLSSARNFGMEHAKGEFISFVDSDDFIEENMLEDLYNLAKKHEADMVVSKIKLYEGSKVTSIIPKAQYTKNILNREEAISEFLKTNITGHAWNKLYRRELFHIGHIKYPEGLLYEDIPTTLQLIAMGKKIVLTEDSFYYYRQRENAITKKISYKAVKDHFAVIEFVDNYIKKLDLDKNTKFYLKEFIVNELSYNYKLLIRYYLFTLNRDKIEDEQESLIIKRCRSINLLKYIFSLRVNKKILLKAILIDLNLYKFYVVRGGKYET